MNNEKRRLLAKIAYLYYIEGKNQAEISTELDIYRTTVSRLINRARTEGIVHIDIKDFDPALFALEEYVRTKYHLKKIEIIADQVGDSKQTRMENVARAAAELVKNVIKDKDVVGISWGSTLSKLVDNIGTKTLENVEFCPLTGGPSHVNLSYHVNTLVYRIARAFHGRGTFVNAMVLQENADIVQGICKSKYFRTISNVWSRLNVAIVGVGDEPNRIHDSQWRDLLTQDDLAALDKAHAIGDVCCRFFNADGEAVCQNLQDRTIGVRLDEFTRIPKTVAVACGENKAPAILAILRKKYINHLVTDKTTILKVLELDNDENVADLLC